MWGAWCEKVGAANPYMIFLGKDVGLYPDSSEKSLEGLKPTNDVIRFWSWRVPSLCSMKRLDEASMDTRRPGRR